METHKFWACCDCHGILEFGSEHFDVITFYQGEEEGTARIDRINKCIDEICDGDPDFKLHFLTTGDEKIDFSWSKCEICGSTLGGERYEVIFARR